MSRSIVKRLAFPKFEDEEVARRAWAVYSTSLLVAGYLLTYGLVISLISPESWQRLAAAGAMIPVASGCAAAARRGHVLIPGLFLTGLAWSFLFAISSISGGVSAPAASGQVLVIVIATLILGWGAGLFFAALSVLGLTTLYALEVSGHLPASSLQVDSRLIWLTQSLFLIVIGGLIAFAVRYLEKMLRRAHEEIGEHERSETALRQSESTLAEAQRLTHLGSWQWDLREDRFHGSDEMYRILQLNPKEFKGSFTNSIELVHPDDRDRIEKSIGATVATGVPFVADYKIVRPDGETRYLSARAEVEYNGRGEPSRLFGTMQDMTERYALEEAQRKTENLYELLAQNSDDVIWTMDLNFRWTYVSPSVIKLRGFTPEEVMAETIEGSIAPSSFEEARQAIARIIEAIAKGDNEKREQVTVELEATCKDGSTVWTEQKLALLRDRSGKASGILGVSRDISARKKVEVIATRLGHILDDSLNEVYILEASTLRIIQVNRGARENLGYPLAELREFTLVELQPGTTRGEFDSLIAALKSGERDRVSFTAKHRRRDGTEYFVELQIQRASFGALPAYVAFGLDITERRSLEEELRHSQKMEAIGRLAGGVAHDFNNLLTAILGNADLLIEEFEEKNLPTVDIREIRMAAERAASLTHQLLAFSRKQILEISVIDANESVANVATLLGRLIGENITLVTKLEPNLPPIEADPAQLEQVLINMAVNARDAMPDGGLLTLRTRTASGDKVLGSANETVRKNAHILIEISDTGEGMDEPIQARIFEPFFTTKPRDKGTGLGLSMSYGIIKQIGGEILVESEPGQGTTFRIYLPVTEANKIPAANMGNGISSRRGTERILLVEDEESVRRLTNRILSQSGYSVSEAANGTEALEFLSQQKDPPELLLTDVVLPTINGVDLAGQIIASSPDVKVLFISGYTEEVNDETGLLRIGENFLQKPFTAAVLLAMVRQVLDKREKVDV